MAHQSRTLVMALVVLCSAVVMPITFAGAGTAQAEFDIQYSQSESGADGPSPFTEDFRIRPVGVSSISFGPDTSRSIRIRRADTGAQVTLQPQAGESTYDVTDIEINAGNLIESTEAQRTPRIQLDAVDGTDAEMNVSIQGDLDMFRENAFDPYVIEILNANGDVLAATDQQIHGVRYEVSINQTEYKSSLATDSAINCNIDHDVDENHDETTEWGHWEFVGSPANGQIRDLAVHPNDESRIYAATDDGLFVSSNGGDNWTRKTPGLIQDVEIHPKNPDILFTGTTYSAGIYRSTDGGESWQSTKQLRESDAVRSIYVGSDGLVLAGTQSGPGIESGIWESTDTGDTWQFRSFNSDEDQLIPWDIEMHIDTDRVYIPIEIADHPEPYRPPLFASQDRRAWTDISGQIGWHVTDIEIDQEKNIIYAKAEIIDGGLYKSTDNGESWELLDGNAPFGSILLDPADTSDIYAGGHTAFDNSGMWLSTDGGGSFQRIGLEGHITDPSTFTDGSSKLFVTSWDTGLFWGSNSTWVDIESPESNTVSENSTVELHWEGENPKGEFEGHAIRIDGGEWSSVGANREQACEITNLSNGMHNLSVKAIGEDSTDTETVNFNVSSAVNGTDPFPNGVPGVGSDPPTDPDGDGLYEDVNGDGTADFDDAIALAFADTSNLTQDQIDALDFDGDGDVDFDDAIELAFSI